MSDLVLQHQLEKPVRPWLKNILRGAGSIIVISPPTSSSNFNRFIPSASVEEALCADWCAVGNDLANALSSADRLLEEWDEQAERSENEKS